MLKSITQMVQVSIYYKPIDRMTKLSGERLLQMDRSLRGLVFLGTNGHGSPSRPGCITHSEDNPRVVQRVCSTRNHWGGWLTQCPHTHWGTQFCVCVRVPQGRITETHHTHVVVWGYTCRTLQRVLQYKHTLYNPLISKMVLYSVCILYNMKVWTVLKCQETAAVALPCVCIYLFWRYLHIYCSEW